MNMPAPSNTRKTRLVSPAFWLMALLVLAPALPAETASPFLIPFQGRLTKQDGTAYNSGQYTVTFNLYDQAVGGSTLWTERHERVGVVNGMVNLFLGSINPALANVDFSNTRYLGITIDADDNSVTADPEMVPRQMIVPAFHAKKSENSTKLAGQDWSAICVNNGGTPTNDPTAGFLNGAKVATGSINATQLGVNAVTTAKVEDGAITSAKIANGTIGVDDLSDALQQASVIPPGTIMPFAGPAANLPLGWKLCDGSAISRTTYAALFAAIGTTWGAGDGTSTFAVPNFAGAMLAGTGTGVMNGRNKVGPAVGSFQEDQMQGHWHIMDGANGDCGGAAEKDPSCSTTNNDVFTSSNTVKNPISDGMNGAPRTGAESRPYRAGINYIIKL